jgi:hypothetical protein
MCGGIEETREIYLIITVFHSVCIVTRVRIFDSEITTLKTTRHFNTIDNVKAKIDNVRAKIQDKEERRSWSRPTLARRNIFSH